MPSLRRRLHPCAIVGLLPSRRSVPPIPPSAIRRRSVAICARRLSRRRIWCRPSSASTRKSSSLTGRIRSGRRSNAFLAMRTGDRARHAPALRHRPAHNAALGAYTAATAQGRRLSGRDRQPGRDPWSGRPRLQARHSGRLGRARCAPLDTAGSKRCRTAPLDPQSAGESAEAVSTDFVGRDGIEAPGWYRVEVLPALVRRAVQALRDAQ